MSTKKIHVVVRKIRQNIFYKYFKFTFTLLFFLAWSNCLTCQTINLYAGKTDGIPGYTGDGGPAISARLNYPYGTVSDKQGNLFIADLNNHVVRKVSPSGIISTVAGVGTFGYSGDGGPATSAALWSPSSVAIDTSGDLYILDFMTSVVRKVNKQGIISTIAGNGTIGYSGDGGPANLARLNHPIDLAIDKAGNIYIADKENKVVRKVNTSGIISTVAGNGMAGYTGDGGPATAAQLTPYAVATDNAGNLYIADGWNAVIRKVNTSGIISTFAGNGTYGYSGDGGLATSAQFAAASPNDIAFDNAGNLYVADYQNQVIRRINTSGIISTVAGISNQSGYSGDGGPALAATLWFPMGISVDSCNNFYISDTYNDRIRKVSSDDAATVLAGPENSSVCENSKVSFGIRAANTTNFQWMINTGSGWKNVEDNETYSGANTDTLQISKATMPMDNYQYLCLVSNSCGPVYSLTATLSVKPATLPALTITASDTSICKGTQVTFSAAPLDAEANAVYQWKKNGVNVGAGTISYSDTSLKDGDIISCTLTSANSCLSTNVVLSNSIVINVDTVLIPFITITASSDTICYGMTVAFLASTVNAGNQPVFQWKKNGSNVGTNNLSFTSDQLTQGDVVTCTLMNNDACASTPQVTSNPVTIAYKNDNPEVTIIASSDTICAGTGITFTATNKSKSRSPSYQWLVDGKMVGSDSTVFATNTLSGNPVVECIMRVPQCAGTSKDYSNPIPVKVYAPLNPSVNITSSPQGNFFCKGTGVTFVATAEQAGSNPFYQWQINGQNVGTDSSHFTTSSLNDGDIITCVLHADSYAKCLQYPSITSNAITVNIQTPAHTPVNIFASANNFCGSKPVTFTTSEQSGGKALSCLWLLNGNKAGTDSVAYTNMAPGNNDHVKLVVTTVIPGCSPAISDTSNTIAVSIKPIPGILLSPSDTTVMAGTQVQLNTLVTGDIASYSWTPKNGLISSQTFSPLTIPVTSTTKYKLTVVAANGCINTTGSTIKVTVKLYMPAAFTPNGDGKNDVFRIPPGTSINLTELSVYNRWGTKIFSTSDINKGWEGNYKGAPAEVGVYIYTIKATDYQDKDIHLKGTVLLMR
jgi:gliding motility-associated-like protein